MFYNQGHFGIAYKFMRDELYCYGVGFVIGQAPCPERAFGEQAQDFDIRQNCPANWVVS